MQLKIKEFYKEKYWREIRSWHVAGDILVYRLACGHKIKISFSRKDFYESLIDDQNCMKCWMCKRLGENETHH